MGQSSQVVRALIEQCLNKGHIELITELVHTDYQYHSPGESLIGAEALKQLFLAYRQAFPDLMVSIEEQFESGQKVCTRLTLRGTNRGPFLGAPATLKTIDVSGVVISRVIEGRIREEWELIDEIAMSRQLGLVA